MSPLEVRDWMPEYEVTILVTVKKKIKALNLVEAERVARLMISDGAAKLHSVIPQEKPK